MAVTAALAVGSVALLGFGLDSFVETLSGLIILWRIAAERRGNAVSVARLEETARRGVSLSLWLLGAFVTFEAVSSLIGRERPSSSAVGIVLLVVSIAVMRWLAAAKRRVAVRLHSHALEADAEQTDMCWRLSVTSLAGLALNAAFGWWWADPVAALGLAVLIAYEARETWRGDACCS